MRTSRMRSRSDRQTPPVRPAPATPQSRTTTASSAKNQAVAVLTTTTPSTETIMASTTLTLPAAETSPAAAQSFGTAHGTILALDLGRPPLGIALGRRGAIVSGTVSFRPDRWQGGGIRYLRFKRWLTRLRTRLAASTGRIRRGSSSCRSRRCPSSMAVGSRS